jgi:hypothetical protein
MAVEPKRGCGYRKVGGIYLVGEESEGEYCHRLPIQCDVCPVCKSGIKQTRGLTWIDPVGLWEGECSILKGNGSEGLGHCTVCPACDPALLGGDELGLLWVGERYYPTPQAFNQEAKNQGISRRIPAIPKGFILGKHYIAFGHPKAIPSMPPDYDPPKAGIFKLWKPRAIEMIITQTQSGDADFMKDLETKGLTPVIVPDDDPDHR